MSKHSRVILLERVRCGAARVPNTVSFGHELPFMDVKWYGLSVDSFTRFVRHCPLLVYDNGWTREGRAKIGLQHEVFNSGVRVPRLSPLYTTNLMQLTTA
jgi:hypothetical protein